LLPTEIEVQEAERSRIARELHDDICQRLVVLGMQLDRIMQDLPVSAADLKQAVEEAHDQTSSLANDIRAGPDISAVSVWSSDLSVRRLTA